MVITGIQIKNFKGFEFTQIIELKPITLIFGDNSSGKSTITQALQYVREILLRGNVNPDKTTLGGETIDLGGFRNFVNKKDISKEITLRINWDGSRTDMPEYISPYLGSDNADMENHNLDFNDMLNNYIPNFTPNGWIEFEIAWSELKEEPYLKTYEIGYGDEILGIIDSSHDTGKTQISFLNFGHKIFSLSEASSDSSFMEVPEYFDELVGFKDLTISNIKEICFREGTFFPVKTLYNQHQGTGKEVIARLTEMKDSEGNTLSEGEAEKRKRQIDGIENSLQLKALSTIGNQVSISLSNLLTPLPETGQQLHLGDNFSEDAEDQGITIIQAIINFLFVAPLDILRDSFSPMCYIGPLRAVPGRDYKPQLSPSPEEYNWANGFAAYDILYHSSSQFINEVNKWLKEGHINLGYQIKLEKYKKIESDGWLFGNLRMALDENDGFIPFSAEEFHEYIRDAQEIKELTLRENNTG